MHILNNRILIVLLASLIVSALLILDISSLDLSALLFAAALLIIAKTANSAAKKQEDTALWIDAQWRSQTEKNDGHT